MKKAAQFSSALNISLLKGYIQFYPTTWLLLLIQTIAFLTLPDLNAVQFDNIFELAITSICCIVLSVHFVNLIAFGNKGLTVTFNIALVCIYLLLDYFHLLTHSPLEYAFLSDNFREIFYPEVWTWVQEDIGFIDLLKIVGIAGVFFTLQYFMKFFSAQHKGKQRPLKILITMVVYLLLLIFGRFNVDEIAYFAKTTYQYNVGFSSSYSNYVEPEGSKQYPYVHNVVSTPDSLPSAQRPNVFILMLESCNENFLNVRTSDGKEITPNLNRLSKQGVFVENFYGNSVVTCKGQFATLSGILPSFWGDVFKVHEDLELNSLPEILQDNGYKTIWIQGFDDLNFANTGNFLEKNGFDEIQAMEKAVLSPEEQKHVWGWGLQDDYLYKRFFNYLDKELAALPDSIPPQPYFGVLATISHHYPYRPPEEQRYMYSQASTDAEHFANSIHLEDKYLDTFFDELNKRPELNKSVVVIVGDHSIPVETVYGFKSIYEDRYKVPFILLHSDSLAPLAISNEAYSQVDIAPTILDVIGLNVSNHFIGKSILQPTDSLHFVHINQPWDGTYLITIKYPWKYILHERTGQEYLFNLDEADGETTDLLRSGQSQVKKMLSKLRNASAQHYLNQRLIEEDRIWKYESKRE